MARSFCALALLCAYLAHRQSTSEMQSQLRHWLLERCCGGCVSVERTMEDTRGSCFSLTFSVVLSTPSKRPALPRCIALPTVFFFDSLIH
ncbi:hypothetical protein P692DRAFT_201410787 [Suillus brevipes Sb2]|nr:hypothetical protein P692DRAFT_201410787 [Suillus brevipes Sb2]